LLGNRRERKSRVNYAPQQNSALFLSWLKMYELTGILLNTARVPWVRYGFCIFSMFKKVKKYNNVQAIAITGRRYFCHTEA
jgi:hypothetical protein